VPDEILTPKALAERWGTTTGALAQQRYKGNGPVFVRLGGDKRGTVRYRLADVKAYELAQRYSRTDTKATA
jgi:hypothetical protein